MSVEEGAEIRWLPRAEGIPIRRTRGLLGVCPREPGQGDVAGPSRGVPMRSRGAACGAVMALIGPSDASLHQTMCAAEPMRLFGDGGEKS